MVDIFKKSDMLIDIIKEGNIVECKRFLRENKDMHIYEVICCYRDNNISYQGLSFLKLAIIHENYKIVKLVLDYGENKKKECFDKVLTNPLKELFRNIKIDLKIIKYLLFKKGLVDGWEKKKEYDLYVSRINFIRYYKNYNETNDQDVDLIKLLYILGADIGLCYEQEAGMIPSFDPFELEMESTRKNKKYIELFLDLDIPSEETICKYQGNNEDENIKSMFEIHLKKSKEEKLARKRATIENIKNDFSHKFMEFVHDDIVDICLTMYPLNLPPYVMLWIIDWLPSYELVSHHRKIHLIESIRNSIWKVKGITIE